MTRCTLNRLTLVVAVSTMLAGCSPGSSRTPQSVSTAAPTDSSGPATPAEATLSKSDVSTEHVLGDLTRNVVVPTFRQLEADAAALESSSATFCQAPSPAMLAEMRQAWRDTRAAWMQSHALRFGPIEDLRLRGVIDWWPVNPDRMEAWLATDDPVTPEKIASLGSTLRGLGAVEALIFPDGQADAAVLASLGAGGDARGGRRCAYLADLAQGVHGGARTALCGWVGPGEDGAGDDGACRGVTTGKPGAPAMAYAAVLSGAGDGNAVYPSAQAALGDVVNFAAVTLETLADTDLGKPLGHKSGGTPQPDEVRAPLSDNAWADIRNGLLGVKHVYVGNAGMAGGDGDGDALAGLGLGALVHQRSPDTDARVRAALDAALAAVEAAPEPLEQMVVDDPAGVEAIYAAVKQVQRIFQTEVASLLGVTLTFNANDGD